MRNIRPNKSKNPLFSNGKGSGKVTWNPYPGSDHQQKLISSFDWDRFSHNGGFNEIG